MPLRHAAMPPPTIITLFSLIIFLSVSFSALSLMRHADYHAVLFSLIRFSPFFFFFFSLTPSSPIFSLLLPLYFFAIIFSFSIAGCRYFASAILLIFSLMPRCAFCQH